MTTARSPESRTANTRWLPAALAVLWLAVVSSLMVTDVWDESRVLDTVQEHGVGELLMTNWKQAELGPVVLFRPLPMMLFTAVAATIREPDLTWRLLRLLNALLVLGAGALLLDALRRSRGPEPGRELAFAVGFLFSGSALITAGWFANAFDATALFFVALAIQQLFRGRPSTAGAALGLALFCKEVAVLGIVVLVVLWWTRPESRREAGRALLIALLLLVSYVGLRSVVVPPGSVADLRPLSLQGTAAALWGLPAAFWWQLPAPPLPWLGWMAAVATIAAMRSWRAAIGVAGLYIATALLYGTILNQAPGPLISPGNFAGRLYLVPAASILFLLAMYGRRFAIVVVLPLLLWGGAVTAHRHFRFQHAYLELYEAAAAAERPLRVFCGFYDPVFRYEHRNLVIGRLRDARWQFTEDGELIPRGRFGHRLLGPRDGGRTEGGGEGPAPRARRRDQPRAPAAPGAGRAAGPLQPALRGADPGRRARKGGAR